MNYKRLGDYIKRISVKNTDGLTEILYGINIDKFFMPSVANVIGTDLTKYKVVTKNQFACNRMHVGRDKRLPISLSLKNYDFIISPAYDVFEITDTDIILPEYLMMWFTREEFDRNCWFHTDSDVRGKLDWDAFMDMTLPIPPIEKQQQIVAEYNTVSNRIKLNETLNQKLEETAGALYKHWFVDFEFPNAENKPYKSSGGEMVYNEELEKEIPVGWSVETVKNFSKDMKSGGTPSRTNLEFWNKKDIPWLKTGEIKNNIITNSKEWISEAGFKGSSTKLLPINTVLMSMYGVNAGEIGFLKFEATTNQACCGVICDDIKKSSYLYYHFLQNQEYNHSQAIGGAQQNLSKDYIENIKLLKPKNDMIKVAPFSTFIEKRAELTKQSQSLQSLQSLLLAKMTQVAMNKETSI